MKQMITSTLAFCLSFGFITANAASFSFANGQAAQSLNAKFQTLTASSSCTDGDMACLDGSFAQCSNGRYVTSPCQSGTSCFALPLVNTVGTALACDSEQDALERINATGVTGGLTGQA